MKTAIIWNEIEDLKYAIHEGDDIMKFRGVYCNSRTPIDFDGTDEEWGNLIDDLFYLSENFQFCKIDKFKEAILNGADLIECGFLP